MAEFAGVSEVAGARALLALVLAAALSLIGCPRGRPPAVISPEQGAQLPPEIRQATLRRLTDIGYAGATGEPAWDGGVAIHLKGGAWPGVNLWTSGHAPIAFLMDMDGRLLHRWRLGRRPSVPFRYFRWRRGHWSRVRAFSDGHLLGLFTGRSLVKLDWRSNLIWAHFGSVLDFDIAPSGEILVLARDDAASNGDDVVIWLTPEGKEIRRTSPARDVERWKTVEGWPEQRLDNGNTLVTERDRGRALEVDPSGKIVWEFLNPNGMGPARSYRASVTQMERLPPRFFDHRRRP